MSRPQLRAAVLITAYLCHIAVCAGANSFTGKWKLNRAKSRVPEQMDSVTRAGPHAWRFAFGSFSWTVQDDGNDYPKPQGGSVALQVKGPMVWQLTNKVNHKVVSVDTWTLAEDCKTMTRTSAGLTATGERSESTITMKRAGKGNGFEGAWKGVVASQAEIMEVEARENGITVRIPDDSSVWACEFDGGEYPVGGPGIPAGLTLSGRRLGARKIAFVTKLNARHWESEEWILSAGGATITIVEHDPGFRKAVVWVYERH